MSAVTTGMLPAPQWSNAQPHGRILLVDGNRMGRRSLHEALETSVRAHIESTETLPERDEGWELVIVEAQTVGPDAVDRVFERFARQHAAGGLIVRVPSSERHDVHRWFQRGVRHAICREEPHAEVDVISTARKQLWGGALGAECYLHAGARTWTMGVRSSQDKRAALEQTETLAQELGLGGRKTEALRSVAEELISNALYNAPVDAAGNRRFAHLERNVAVELEPHEEVRVVIACDDDRVAFSVTDPFGSLAPETVPAYLAKCFQRGDDQIDDKQGGAGLGLYFAYRSLSHLAVNIVTGRSTEFIGFMDMFAPAGAIQRRAHSFGLFVRD